MNMPHHLSFVARVRRVSTLLLVACSGFAPLPHAQAAGSEPNAPDPLPLSNTYAPFVGEPFFLLSDATFGSADVATVRLEVNTPQLLEQTGGVDIRVYRIPRPLEFLQKQKDLHRVQVAGRPADEGLGNLLTHLWDSWVVKSRLTWQKLFSAQARQAVTREAPGLKTPKALKRPSTFEEMPQFQPVAGLTVVERFRYPVQAAQPIQPPKNLKLAGSSSGFIQPSPGNVFVPLGARPPGLYLVEAFAGQYRATTLLFVSDTVALTKVSNEQMMVWAAHRVNGAPVPGTRMVWTDGVGTLKSGAADAQGVLRLNRKAPEQTYVFGEDPAGGVFISENFYYDSEVYTAKVYAVTDRPLYRPGDWVEVRVSGREFKSARESVPLKDASLALVVLDPAGQMVNTQTLAFSGAHGADTRFALPDNAPAGGYELRFTMGHETYTAAFRVADYQKPHFEIVLLPDKTDFATGEGVHGRLQLNYPDGKPVAGARLSLTARAQKLTMIDGELGDTGQFPLKLAQSDLVTDGEGVAKFTLPAAEQPSRYILTALATDGAAYRVRTTREILIERGSGAYQLAAQRRFSAPGERVQFTVAESARAGSAAGADLAKPARWERLRLENRARDTGTMPAGDVLTLQFEQPGSYTVSLRDERGRLVAATSHWVSGEGLKAPVGSIELVFNHSTYRPGETAELLVSFPEPVEHALVTLERDQVEAFAMLGRPADWVTSQRLSPTTWKLQVPVREDMSPNVTLSVAYVKNGDYVFQNQGLRVEQPRVVLGFHTAKAVYAPGEVVEVDVNTTLGGQPVVAEVNVAVVDEMIYVLQPEIAPAIDDFFFHPRRNNVRTSASLAFIGYDLATDRLGELPAASRTNSRAIKVLERPRRDNIDTAAWLPRLTTNAAGRASFRFTMPDSLTRWRITGRAMEARGNVGQQLAWVRSDKPFYAKWTSPTWQREGDQAQAAVALFNQTGREARVEWEVQGPGLSRKETVTLRPGVSFVTLPVKAGTAGTASMALTLRQDNRVMDRLDTPLQQWPVAWRAPRSQVLDLAAGNLPLKLPADATRVRVAWAQDAAAGHFNRWMEDLIEFPYGCVEQTASRMLPLSLALQSLSPAQQALAPQLTQRLSTARLALAQMAGPQARFGWWGRDMADDAFMTHYAYYADWRATQALKTSLPDSHWQRLLDVYAAAGVQLPLLQRALVLAWMHEMDLPVTPMLAALLDAVQAPVAGEVALPAGYRGSLVLMEHPAVDVPRDMAQVLAVHTAGLAKVSVSAAQRGAAEAAASRLAKTDAALAQALLLLTPRGTPDAAQALLSRVREDAPTFDRAQALLWIHRSLGGKASVRSDDAGPTLPAPWRRGLSPSGEPAWDLPAGAALPDSLAVPAGSRAAWAFVSYESRDPQEATLPVRIERTLWRVVPQSRPARADSPPPTDGGRLRVRLEAVEPGTPLDSNALYLDQLKLSSARPLRWALLEAALPPGAAVESGTWGIDIDGGAVVQPLERAQHEPSAQGYAVPVDALPANGSVLVRHLVRFSQRGVFVLPPTRLYRMYEPEAKGYDLSGRWARMDVR